MSHPNPSHDPENSYPDDHYKPSGKLKHMAKKAVKMGKKMKGDGEYSKVTFTPRNKSEERGFKKRFQSKTG